MLATPCFGIAAALTIARTPEKEAERAAAAAAAALPPEPPPQLAMTVEEALAQAKVEGVTLVRSADNQTGYQNVFPGKQVVIPPLPRHQLARTRLFPAVGLVSPPWRWSHPPSFRPPTRASSGIARSRWPSGATASS